MTIYEYAEAMRAAFTTKTRDNGETFYLLKDGSPEWMQDACRAAHDAGDMLPDDWRYEAIHDAVETICDLDSDSDFDDARDSFIDSASIYNHALIKWFGSHGSRPDYVDEAVREYGWPDGGVIQAIAMGQVIERAEVWDSLVAFLEGLPE